MLAMQYANNNEEIDLEWFRAYEDVDEQAEKLAFRTNAARDSAKKRGNGLGNQFGRFRR